MWQSHEDTEISTMRDTYIFSKSIATDSATTVAVNVWSSLIGTPMAIGIVDDVMTEAWAIPMTLLIEVAGIAYLLTACRVLHSIASRALSLAFCIRIRSRGLCCSFARSLAIRRADACSSLRTLCSSSEFSWGSIVCVGLDILQLPIDVSVTRWSIISRMCVWIKVFKLLSKYKYSLRGYVDLRVYFTGMVYQWMPVVTGICR